LPMTQWPNSGDRIWMSWVIARKEKAAREFPGRCFFEPQFSSIFAALTISAVLASSLLI